jgi:iron complex outermembrane receptor protein
VGAVFNYNSGQYLRGDESNRNAPLAGYAVVNLHSSYRVDKNFELFVSVMNLFNARYETFGQYGDPTGIGTPGVPAGAAANGPGVDNRFVSPAAPISVSGGVRLKI